MSYALENALFQWEEGERRLRELEPRRRAALERVVLAVTDELRRRLGSFNVGELANLYASDPDWAMALAQRHSTATETPWAVDAAFHRYAREASDFAGGRARHPWPGSA